MNKAAMESAREVYVRGDLAIVFELPYTYYSAYHFDPSDPTERVPVASDKPSSGESVGFGGMLEDGDVDKVKW